MAQLKENNDVVTISLKESTSTGTLSVSNSRAEYYSELAKTYAQTAQSAIEALETSLEDYATVEYVDTALEGKADTSALADYATAADLSSYATLKALEDYATVEYVDTALEGKANASSLDSYYTKDETDSLLEAKADLTTLQEYYSQAEKTVTETFAYYYTKTETDTLLNSKANTSALDSYAKTTYVDEVVSAKGDEVLEIFEEALTNYAKVEDSYTKDEINSLIGDIETLLSEV